MSVRVFIKQDSFFELQSGTIFTTKWGNNYKVVQYKRQMKETKEINYDNLLLHSPRNLPGERHFTPGNSWEVEIIIKRKKKNHTPSQTYLRDL